MTVEQTPAMPESTEVSLTQDEIRDILYNLSNTEESGRLDQMALLARQSPDVSLQQAQSVLSELGWSGRQWIAKYTGYLAQHGWNDDAEQHKAGQERCFAFLKKLVKDDDEDVRMSAYEALATLGREPGEVVDIVKRGLRDDHWKVKQQALLIVARLGLAALLEDVKKKLDDDDDDVRQAALEAFTVLSPDDGLVRLREINGDNHWKVRQKAAELFGRYGTEEDRQYIEKLMGDDDGDVRNAALQGIFAHLNRYSPETADEQKLSLALNKLTDHHNGVVTAAVGILETVEDPRSLVGKVDQAMEHAGGTGAGTLFAFLSRYAPEKATAWYPRIPKMSDAGARLALARAMVEQEAPEREAILDELWADEDWNVRMFSYEELYKLQPARQKELSLRALEDTDSDIQRAALEHLKNCGDQETLAILLPRFDDLDSETRVKVLELAIQHDADNIIDLARKVLEHEGWSTRRDIMNTLGDSGKPGALEVVLDRLEHDSDDDVQAAALEAAVKLAPDQITPMLQRAASSSHWRVRQRAAQCAREHGTENDLSLIEPLLSDDDYDVRQAAMAAMLQLAPLDKKLTLAMEKISDDNSSIAEKARDILQQIEDKDRLFALLDEKFETLTGSYTSYLLDVIQAQDESRLVSYIQRIPRLTNSSARSSMAQKLLEFSFPERVEVWRTLLNDDDSDVRRASYQGLFEELPEQEARQLMYQALDEGSYLIRQRAVEKLGQTGDVTELARVHAKLEDSDDDVRVAAMHAASALDPNSTAAYARQLLDDSHWKVRQHAAMKLEEYGDEHDVAKLQSMLQDSDNDVRQAALNACIALAPARQVEFAVTCLGDSDSSVTERSREILDQAEGIDMVQLAIDKLPQIESAEATDYLLNIIEERAPARLKELRSMVTRIANESARERIVSEIFADEEEEVSLEFLRELQQDSSGTIRKQVFDQLWERLPGERMILAVDALKDENWTLRMAGVEALKDDPDPALLDDLLPLARDADYDVRREALRALAKYDDIRVFGELVSAMDDVNDDVKKVAEECLKQVRKSPMLSRLVQAQTGIPIWVQIRQQVDEINKWATQTGQELLGRPVLVTQPNHQEEEHASDEKDQIIKIELSEKPVTWCHPHGADVMRGMALYKIGHYLWNQGERGFKTMTGIAKSEGVQEIYEILTSERMDRNLRSRRPEWQEPLDHLASYAFAKNVYRIPIAAYAELTESTPEQVLEAVQTGALPGQLLPTSKTRGVPMVTLRDRDLLRIPNALPPLVAFLWCLRCGFEAQHHPDPKIAEAIALVPQNLRTLPHSKVLQVAREIAELLGKGEQHKQDMQKMQQKMQSCGGSLKRCMGNNMGRLAEAGFLPESLAEQMAQEQGGRNQQVQCRKKRQVVYQRPPRSMQKMAGGQTLNLSADLDFPKLANERSLEYNRERHAQLVGSIRKNIRRLRSYFERMGRRTVDEYALRRGHRIDHVMARKSIFVSTPNLLVHSSEELHTDLYLGLLIDRSGSMDGEKLERAKRFGALVAESARGLRGIAGHVNAFDDDTFYYLGDFQRNAIACLESGGSNNDAGALQRAAELALSSRKKNRLLVMISDGSPTECSVESLRHLVEKLTRDYGIICAQVAVETLPEIAFPHYVDLSEYNADEAVTRFGSLLMKLTAVWR